MGVRYLLLVLRGVGTTWWRHMWSWIIIYCNNSTATSFGWPWIDQTHYDSQMFRTVNPHLTPNFLLGVAMFYFATGSPTASEHCGLGPWLKSHGSKWEWWLIFLISNCVFVFGWGGWNCCADLAGCAEDAWCETSALWVVSKQQVLRNILNSKPQTHRKGNFKHQRSTWSIKVNMACCAHSRLCLSLDYTEQGNADF